MCHALDMIVSLPVHSPSVQLLRSLLQSYSASRGRGDPSQGVVSGAGKWKGTTVAVKILEHSAESSSGLKELRESVLSSSIIHPNVVSTYKIRTLPTAARKPLPQVEWRLYPFTISALIAHLDAVSDCSTLLLAAVSSSRPRQRASLILSPSPISSHGVDVAMIAAHEHSFVSRYWRSQTAERLTLGRLRDLAMPGGRACGCDCLAKWLWQLNVWVQGSQDFDAYRSDPEDGKRASVRNSCGPEMLETWLLLEFCDR